MNRFEKFLRRIDAKLRERVYAAVIKILAGDLDDLDIKKMQGSSHLYRCRIGDVRIIFAKEKDGTYIVVDGDFRGNVYKNK